MEKDETSTFSGIYSPTDTGVSQCEPAMSRTWEKWGSPTNVSKVKKAGGRAGELKQSLGWQRDISYFALSKIKMGIDLSWVYKQRTIQDLDLYLRPCSSVVCRMHVTCSQTQSFQFKSCLFHPFGIISEWYNSFLQILTDLKSLLRVHLECKFFWIEPSISQRVTICYSKLDNSW